MKQINVVYQEFKEEIVQAINRSNLPMFLVSEALTVIKAKVDEVANQQLAEAKKQEAIEAAKQEAEKNLAENQDLQTNADEDVL